MTWKPYIFTAGAWSQWNREVVVVEAEKVKEENQEMAAYVKWMDVAIPFSFMFVAPTSVAILILPVVPSLQTVCVSYGTLKYGILLSTFSRTVPTAILFAIPPGSNFKFKLPWHSSSYGPQHTRFVPLQTGCGKFFFFTYVQLNIRYVHGQRVICSTAETILVQYSILQGQRIHSHP